MALVIPPSSPASSAVLPSSDADYKNMPADEVSFDEVLKETKARKKSEAAGTDQAVLAAGQMQTQAQILPPDSVAPVMDSGSQASGCTPSAAPALPDVGKLGRC